MAAAAATLGWQQATPIQAQALPAALQGRDLLGLAPTGSGKTAAFLLPLLQRLLDEPDLLARRPRPLRALILAPTRELAAQIANDAQALIAALAPARSAKLAPSLRTVLAVGGLSINPQMMALRGGAHLVVATPGRLLDLLEHRALNLRDVDCLVLDEADRLLDLGFADEMARLREALPARHQTLLFSATLPPAVEDLANQLLHPDALRIDVRGNDASPADGAAPPQIAQRAIVVSSAQRTPLLRHLMAEAGWQRVLVFVATQYASEHVAEKLERAGIRAAALHGQLSTGRRAQVLADFHQRRLTVLVATDLAARGIDIDRLEVVVNHDLPRSPTDHIHRIGRTGRLNRDGDQPGVAVSFICADAPGSEAHFRLIEKRQGLRVPREQIPGFEPAAIAPPTAADPNGGIKGRRKSKKDKLREAAAAESTARPAPTRGRR
ncbi:MAG TPA: DEAD/DEAH box helicase [Burkholderiaceae bacterium]|nr:DEAD/DEAH box helicase [Burkholderiaceae bacterium]